MELVLPMYNVHSYFYLKNLGKKIHIIHSKIWYLLLVPSSGEPYLIHSLMDVLVVSTFGHYEQWCKHWCINFYVDMLSFPLVIHLRVELLGHLITLCLTV